MAQFSRAAAQSRGLPVCPRQRSPAHHRKILPIQQGFVGTVLPLQLSLSADGVEVCQIPHLPLCPDLRPGQHLQLHIRPGEAAGQLKFVGLLAVPQINILGEGKLRLTAFQCPLVREIQHRDVDISLEHRPGPGEPGICMTDVHPIIRQHCTGPLRGQPHRILHRVIFLSHGGQ